MQTEPSWTSPASRCSAITGCASSPRRHGWRRRLLRARMAWRLRAAARPGGTLRARRSIQSRNEAAAAVAGGPGSPVAPADQARDRVGTARSPQIPSAEKARSRDGALPRAGDTVRWTRWESREERPPRSLRGATEMNTTKLIARWTMSGAGRDVHGRFRAADDIRAVIADHQPTPEPTAAASSFLVKGADEGSWKPLGERNGDA